MKKSLFFYAAATALMLTACSSEDDILQTGQTKKVAPQEVGFDVYTPDATSVTRAGLQGTMTTGRLQRAEAKGGGFGVYAFLTEDAIDAAGVTAYAGRTTAKAPDFMVNEKILWNATNQGWYYNPLKYWPNETNNDSQSSNAEMEAIGGNKHLDRLTFFAYAPYVEAGAIDFGITGVTANNGQLTPAGKLDEPATANSTARDVEEPSVSYRASLANPNKAVDLLWGVAPSGGLTYTAVNGNTVTVPEGEPLIDMTKPDVNTAMKFLFQHALARINVKAVAAIDQVAPGGTLDPNTRITIDNISLKGYFGETGVLNLDNDHVNVANWVNINGKELLLATPATDISDLTQSTIEIGHAQIAQHLRFRNKSHDGGDAADPRPQTDRVGVTTVLQNVLEPNDMTENPDWFTSKTYAAGKLAYSETTPYYRGGWAAANQVEFTMPASYTIDDKGVYTQKDANEHFTYPMVLQNYLKATGFTPVTAGNVDSYVGYQAYSAYKQTKTATPTTSEIIYKDGTYQLASGDELTKSQPIYEALTAGDYIPVSGNPRVGDYVVDGIYFYPLTAGTLDAYANDQLYTASGSTFVPVPGGTTATTSHYVLCGNKIKYVPTNAAELTDVCTRDANYFMVVPTNNVSIIRTLGAADEVALRTVRVKIEYYITTEDSKLGALRAQTKNVVEKDVIFPSLANGKSYNLKLILGLTSVKMEAEVDDWKVVNVNADLPQNTAGE